MFTAAIPPRAPRERLGQNVLERLLLRRDPRLFLGDSFQSRAIRALNSPSSRQLLVAHRLHLRLERIDLATRGSRRFTTRSLLVPKTL